MATCPPPDPDRLDRLRARLGAERVDAMMDAASQAGSAYLPDEHHPVFGFLQRVLIRLKNGGRNYGLIYPKVDGHYQRFIDYFDGEDRIFIIYPGEEPGDMRLDEAWVVRNPQSSPDMPFYEIAPGCEAAVMLSFLEAYAHWREKAEAAGAET